MELRQIECFLAVADELNFTKAAERLYVSQPSLSRHIKNLEDEIGLDLFERDTKNVVLTPAGVQLVSTARAVKNAEADFSHTVDKLKEGKEGKLRIGYQNSARRVLSEVLTNITEILPDIDLYLDFFGAYKLIHLIDERELDFALTYRLVRENCPHEHELDNLTIDIDNMGLFMGRDIYNKYKSRKNPRLIDFKDETFFEISRYENPAYYDVIDEIYRLSLEKRPYVREVDHLDTMIVFLEGGFGVSLLPIKSTLTAYPDINYIELKNVNRELFIELLWCKDNLNPCLSKAVEGLNKIYK